MKDQLIKLRAIIMESCDVLNGERLESEKKRNQRNLIVAHLEKASIEAGVLLRELNEE